VKRNDRGDLKLASELSEQENPVKNVVMKNAREVTGIFADRFSGVWPFRFFGSSLH